MNGIQDKYRIQSRWSTDELKNHLSRTGDWAIAVNVWQRYKYSVKFTNTLQYLITYPVKFANTLQYLITYPTKFAKSFKFLFVSYTKVTNTLKYLITYPIKFANPLQYQIPSTQSPVPDPQYRDQQKSVTEFLREDKSLPPPLKAVTACSGVAQLPRKSKFPKKKLGSR